MSTKTSTGTCLKFKCRNPAHIFKSTWHFNIFYETIKIQISKTIKGMLSKYSMTFIMLSASSLCLLLFSYFSLLMSLAPSIVGFIANFISFLDYTVLHAKLLNIFHRLYLIHETNLQIKCSIAH